MVSSVSGNNFQFGVASLEQRQREMFSKLDSSGDGKIDISELEAMQKKHEGGPAAADLMKEIDTNGDNVIDEDEHSSFIQKMEEKRKTMGPPPPPQGYTQNGEQRGDSGLGMNINELI